MKGLLNWRLLSAIIALHTTGFGVGYFFARLFKADEATARTIRFTMMMSVMIIRTRMMIIMMIMIMITMMIMDDDDSSDNVDFDDHRINKTIIDLCYIILSYHTPCVYHQSLPLHL